MPTNGEYYRLPNGINVFCKQIELNGLISFQLYSVDNDQLLYLFNKTGVYKFDYLSLKIIETDLRIEDLERIE